MNSGNNDELMGISLVARHLESANTMFSFVWWVIGFYWICVGGQALQLNSPELYWLCAVFLAFDVFFVIFCVALASVIDVAVCCCHPCIVAVLYVLADRVYLSPHLLFTSPLIDHGNFLVSCIFNPN